MDKAASDITLVADTSAPPGNAAQADSARTVRHISSFRKCWVLGLLVLIYASNFIDRIIVAIAGEAMKAELQLSDFQLGLVGGLAFAAVYAALGIPIARLAERYSRVRIISACVVIWSGFTALCGVAQGYVQLLLFRMGVGAGEAGCAPASHSLLADCFSPGRRATVMAIYSLGIPIGALSGSLLVGWIVQNVGWREAFIIMGAIGIALACLALLTIPEPLRGLSDGVKVDRKEKVPSLKEVLRLLLAKLAFVRIVIGCAVLAFGKYGINLFIPVYLVRVYGMSFEKAGFLFGLIAGIAGALGSLIGGYLADRGGRRDKRWYVWVPAIGAMLSTPLYILAFTQTDWMLAVALMIVMTTFVSFWTGPTFSAAHAMVDSRMRASASAIILVLAAIIGNGLGPAAMGLVSDLLAGHYFALGDFSELCPAGKALPEAGEAVLAACRQASSDGIRYAIVSFSFIFFIAGLFYLYAGRTLRQDVRPTPNQ